VFPVADERAILSIPRVVVLSPESLRPVLANLGANVECVSVANPYEAAAEIIASPAMAVVIDLRLMAPRHLRLLQIARAQGAELLAVGAIPAGLSAEDLSGVRLTARAELKAVLEAILKTRQGRYEGAAAQQGKRAVLVPAPSDAQEPLPGEIQDATPVEEIERPHLNGQSSPPVQTPSPLRQVPVAPLAEQPLPRPRPGAQDPRSILSSEEMAALLEDES
jgi:hypothetical protein